MKKLLLILGLTVAGTVLVYAQSAVNFLNARLKLDSNGALMVTGAVAGTQGPATNLANTRVKIDSGGNLMVALSSASAMAGTTMSASGPAVTAGADAVVTNAADFTRERYQATITPAGGVDCAAAFKAAALTADCTIATLPAGMKLVGMYADVTAGFTCAGTCTGTKTIGAGKTAGGVEMLAAGLNVAATGTFGLADADLGTALVRAAAIQGGYLNSWTATTPVIVRFTSGTGNWGNATATFVNAGSVKFTLVTEQVK